MARITGISTPVGGASWEYTDDDSSSAIMYIAVLLEPKRLLTMPWSRVNCSLPFELDVEYCTRSASELKAVIPFILSSHKVSPSVLLAIHEVIHALNDFLNDVAPVRDPPVMIDKSNQQQRFQSIVKQLKEKIAHTMEPLLKDVVPQESSFDIWRILNKSVKV